MNLIQKINDTFNFNQQDLLLKYLNNKVTAGSILWKSTFDKEFEKGLENISFPVEFDKVVYKSIINDNLIDNTFNLINIDLLTLSYQYYNLLTIVNEHEMFRKDDVNTKINKKNNNLSILDNDIINFSSNDVVVDDTIIEMNPSVLTNFPIYKTSIEIFPKEYIDKSGNIPDPDNITSNISDYWLSEVITKYESECGAYITLEFNGYAQFNLIQFNFAGKYVPTIRTVYIKENDVWVSKNFKTRKNGKLIEIYFEDEETLANISYSAPAIKVKLVQEKYDFLWEKIFNQEDEILKNEITSTDYIEDYIKTNDASLNKEKVLYNVFSYIFGAYFIKVLYRNYNLKNRKKVEFIFKVSDETTKSFILTERFSVGGEHVQVFVNDVLQTTGYTEYNDNTIIFDNYLANQDDVRIVFYKDTVPTTFISKPYYLKGKNIVEIESEEVLNSPFTIDYKILDENGNEINTSVIKPYENYTITTKSNELEVFNNLSTNFIKLKSFPILNNNLNCSIDGVEAERVEEFKGNNLQYIAKNDFIYFNKVLTPNDTVQVQYERYTNFIQIKIEMRINTDYIVTNCPAITDLKVNIK